MYKNLIKLIENDLFEKESYRFNSFKKWVNNIEDIKEINDLETVFQDLFMIKVVYAEYRGYYQIIKEDDDYLLIVSNRLAYDEIRIILVFVLAMILLCPNDVTNEYHYQEIVRDNKILIIHEHRLVMQFILEFLMPKASVKSFVRVLSCESVLPSEKLIDLLAKKYHVNAIIVRKRLITLGLID